MNSVINKAGFMSVCLIIMAQTIFQVASLRLGAFNIQVFGKSKASKPEVMKVLVGILSRYDLVLIQEIRDSSGTSINELLKQVNAANSGDPFEMSLSDRLGRTASKEQYAFLYRPSAFTVLDTYHYEDGDESLNTDTTIVDKFQREPYVVLFESKLTKIGKFAVAGIHVDPDEAVEELKHLEHVFDDAKSRFKVNDVVVMGDLNADCSYVPKYRWKEIPLKSAPEYKWLITDDVDTTVSGSDCAYDRFIVTGASLMENIVTGSSRVFLFDNHYELDSTKAMAVSDHYPIEFEMKTVTNGTAGAFSSFDLTVLCVLSTTAVILWTSLRHRD